MSETGIKLVINISYRGPQRHKQQMRIHYSVEPQTCKRVFAKISLLDGGLGFECPSASAVF